MKNDFNPEAFLVDLTDDDRAMLMKAGRSKHYRKDDLIIEEGDTIHGISILLSGRVRVVRAYVGTAITIATISQGEIFGEMGLIEGIPASASVICDSDTCEVFFIDTPKLDSLLQSVPGMAVRFYRSMSSILSHRVRDVSARIPSLMVEEVAQVQRVPETHTGRAETQALPPSLIEGVTAFKNAMAVVEVMLSREKKPAAEAQVVVDAACSAIRDGLQQHVTRNRGLADAIGAYVFRETFPFFMASRITDRCYTKPRGYAGDFETINMIYQGEAAGDGRIGPLIDRWAMSQAAPTAVRQRRTTLMSHIARIKAAQPSGAPVNITSLAVGPGREFFDVIEADKERSLFITGVDIDPESLNFVAARARELGVSSQIRLIQGNIIRMARGKQPVEIPPQHLVYSLGLMDYLEDAIVVTCIDWMFDMLLPDGEAIIGNFDAENPDKAYLDYIMEWVLTHRSADDLREIFSRSKFGKRPVEVFSDTTKVQLFARCVKT